MKRLHSLKASEISSVPEGAIRKRFLVLKEGDSENPAWVRVKSRVKTVIKSLTKREDESENDGVDSQLEELSPGAQTALRAVGRIIAPHADEITDSHLDAVQEAAGIGAETGEDTAMKVNPEHQEEAMGAASKAYKESMKKLGYAKYPEGKLSMKMDDEEEDEETKKARLKKEADDAEKAKKESKVGKENILKEDGSINIEAVPAEMRPVVEAIAKMNTVAIDRAKAAETKLEAVQKELTDTKAATRKAEIVRKSAEFSHLNAEDVQKTLELADKAGPEEYARVVKMFDGQNAVAKAGDVFSSKGSSHPGSGGAMDAHAKIEKAVEGIVQKSGEKGTVITKEAAYAAFLETPEGTALYAQHQASRPHGI